MDNEIVERRRYVRAQAEAEAAAPATTAPRIVTVAFIEVEDTPAHTVSTPEGEELELDPEWASLPDPFGAFLDRLLVVDSLTCGYCDNAIGYVLTDREGPHGEEIPVVQWRPVVLVRGVDPDTAVALCCWDCGPRLPEP